MHIINDEKLKTKYADRLDRMSELFDQINSDDYIDRSKLQPGVEKFNNWVFYQGRHNSYCNIHLEAFYPDVKEDLYYCRTKIYITDKNIHSYENRKESEDLSNYQYFCDLKIDFEENYKQHVIDYLKDSENYKNSVNPKFSLMLIKYDCPALTETNFDHRSACTDTFGPDHTDETFMGLHMGESYQEVQFKVNNEWQYVDELDDGAYVLFFGDYASDVHAPTHHRMIPNQDRTLPNTRYSIIYNLIDAPPE